MGKTIERMRSDPRADWQISDVEKACREAGVACMKPAGGSYYKIGNPKGGSPVYDSRATPHKGGLYHEAGAVPPRGGYPMIDRSKLVTTNGTLFDPAQYEVVLRPLSHEEGGGWLATIPALPGCTGDGETEMRAIEDVRLAALEWAHAATADGDPVPAPPRISPMAAE